MGCRDVPSELVSSYLQLTKRRKGVLIEQINKSRFKRYPWGTRNI